jgi:polar amino acid transport system substrate-binding protein
MGSAFAASLTAVALAAVVLLLPGCSAEPAHGSRLDAIRGRGVLLWGGDIQGGEPYVYRDPNDPSRLIGFEVAIADALARELGVRAEFVQSDWSTLIPSLERGGFDIAMNGVEVTKARSGRVAFTRPYYVFAERLMARRGDARFAPLASAPPPPATRGADALPDLSGLRIATLSSSLAFELLRDRAEVVAYEGVEEPYVDLLQGRVDAVLLDDVIASRYGETKPELEVVSDVAEGYYAIAIDRNESELAQAIDAALARIIATGELRTILESSRLWNERQARLARWSVADQNALVAAAPKTTFGLSHAALFLRAAAVTLVVSLLAMGLAMSLGMALAVLRLYGPRWARLAGNVYVELFRGTPVLLQLYLLYFGLASLVKIDAFTAAVLGLGLNYAAYEAEVYRAGIAAVPSGQLEAAYALGMSTPLALRRIVLPQAFRLALPNTTNDFIALLKDSSLVSVITVVELTKQMTVTAIDVRSWLVPGLACAALYFAMSYPLARRARTLEARLRR